MTQPAFKVPVHNRSPLEVARAYISAGVGVFPCYESDVEEFNPGTGEIEDKAEKSPRNPNGLKGASRTPRIIDKWFNEKYPSAIIGLPTGENLGAFVLDIDRHGDEDGFVWLDEMEVLHGPLPATARASTANGGMHVYFTHIPDLGNRTAIAPGADIRGEAGYVVAPGSVMADGREYCWLDADGEPYYPVGIPEFAPAPLWLVDLLAKPAFIPSGDYVYTSNAEPEDKSHYVETVVRAEIEGLASRGSERNHAINIASFNLGTLVGAGLLARSEAEAQIMSAAHANGYIAKRGERAARNTMNSGLKSGIAKPRQIQDRAQATPSHAHQNIQSLITNSRKKAAEWVEPVADNDDEPASPEKPRKRERFELTWFDEIIEGKPKETIVKGVLGESEFTVLSGLPGTGKSVIVTDMACHIAAGMEWHGRRIQQGLVVYVAAERKKLTERRMMAFRKHHGAKDVPLLVVGGRLDFTKDLTDANALAALIKEKEIETEMKCVLVVIDTLTRVFGAGDQNTSKDMTRFVQSCDQLLDETKSHVMVIHHTAWAGERMKGAIDLDGAVDATFLVKKDHGKYKLVCNGTNDGEEGDILAFKMDSVVLGVDEDGEATTAPVVVPVADAVGKPVSGGPNGINAKVLAALGAAIAAEGVEPEGRMYPDGILVVTEDDWRAAYYASESGKEDTVRKRFGSGRKKLLETGAVLQVGQWYWAA